MTLTNSFFLLFITKYFEYIYKSKKKKNSKMSPHIPVTQPQYPLNNSNFHPPNILKYFYMYS